jgi:hypothetical protein
MIEKLTSLGQRFKGVSLQANCMVIGPATNELKHRPSCKDSLRYTLVGKTMLKRLLVPKNHRPSSLIHDRSTKMKRKSIELRALMFFYSTVGLSRKKASCDNFQPLPLTMTPSLQSNHLDFCRQLTTN